MHVRIAWEILHHQKKENPEKTSTTPNLTKTSSAAAAASASASVAAAAAAAHAAAAAATPSDLHRPPSHIFPSASVLQRPPELSATFPPGLAGRPYDTAGIPAGFLGPTSHLGVYFNCISSFSIPNWNLKIFDLWFTGSAVSPFGRYASPFSNFPSLAFGRDIPIGAPPSLHDPWRKWVFLFETYQNWGEKIHHSISIFFAVHCRVQLQAIHQLGHLNRIQR